MDNRALPAAAAIIGLTVVAAGYLAGGRYEMSPALTGVVRLDRWTGEVVGCSQGRCFPVLARGHLKTPAEPQAGAPDLSGFAEPPK